MFDKPLQRLPAQVKPVMLGVAALQPGDDAQSLRIVIEPAVTLHRGVEHVLAGMAKTGVAKIMRQRHRLGQLDIKIERRRHRPRHLRHLDGMRQTRAEIITLMLDEHLGLVLQTPERRGMDDPVPVALKGRTEGAFFLWIKPPAGRCRVGRIGGCHSFRTRFCLS